MKIFLSILCFALGTLVTSLSCSASFSDEWNAFLQSSPELKNLSSAEQEADLNSQEMIAARDWIFTAGLRYEDSFVDDLFGFFVQPTERQIFELGLEKQFLSGTTFQWQERFTSYDLRGWSGAQAENLPTLTPFESRHSFTLSQGLWRNFLGASQKLQQKALDQQLKLNQIELSRMASEEILKFFNAYLNLKQKKTVKRIREKFLTSASQRQKLVQGRFRSGVSRKVDFLQAKLAMLSKREELALAREEVVAARQQYFEIFPSESERELDISDELLEWKSIPDKRLLQFEIKNNLQLQEIKERLKLAQVSMEEAHRLALPQLNLRLSYMSNSIDSRFSESFENSLPGERFREKTIGLLLTYPLGQSETKRRKSLAKVKKAQVEVNLQTAQQNLEALMKSFKERFQLLDEILTLATEKLRLAESALVEQNRLYRTGEKQLDEVIAQEETLINALNSVIQFHFTYDLLWAGHLQLSGKLPLLGQLYQESKD